MKKRLLLVIDSLVCGGAKNSLISLLPLIDYDRYDVALLIFARGVVFANDYNLMNGSLSNTSKIAFLLITLVSLSVLCLKACAQRKLNEFHFSYRVILCSDDRNIMHFALQSR